MLSAIIDFLRTLTTPDRLLKLLTTVLSGWLGYALFFGIIFAETGLLTGFFLPGDSFLFTIGVIVGAAGMDLRFVVLSLALAGILGDSTGYLLGRKTGPRIFGRPNSRFFRREHLLRSKAFYDKHGGKTIIYAKFVPIIRTFAPFLAGVSEMPYPKFVTFSATGVVLWVNAVVFAGYFLGQNEFVRKNFDKAVLLIIALSLVPIMLETLKHRRQARKAESTQADSH